MFRIKVTIVFLSMVGFSLPGDGHYFEFKRFRLCERIEFSRGLFDVSRVV